MNGFEVPAFAGATDFPKVRMHFPRSLSRCLLVTSVLFAISRCNSLRVTE